MSLKVKLFSAVVSLFLVASIILIGVYAASSGAFQMGGNVTFVADDILCKITGSVENSSLASPILLPLEWGREVQPTQHEKQTWTGNGLAFKYDRSSIVFRITIENKSTERYIEAKLSDNIKTPSTSLKAEFSFENAEGNFDAYNLNEIVQIPKSETRDFLITFSYTGDRNNDLSINYSYTMYLEDENNK